MDKIFEIVQASAALEGSTLTQAECARLLSEGISSEGKTIAEQLRVKYVIRDEPPPVGKDCNDYLMHVCQQNKSRRMAAARFEHPR